MGDLLPKTVSTAEVSTGLLKWGVRHLQAGNLPHAIIAAANYRAAGDFKRAAEALVESLKSRQYSAFIVNPSLDKFFHVQVGPFTDIKDAESMRAKLVSDGYNPILKK